MTSITRCFEIDAGHRLLRHEGNCRHIHGHRYQFQITVSAVLLDTVGRIIDFTCLKNLVGHWLNTYWDHSFLYQEGDPLEQFLLEHEMRCFKFTVPPTAEHLAEYLFSKCTELLPQLKIVRVVCYETPNCSATYPET